MSIDQGVTMFPEKQETTEAYQPPHLETLDFSPLEKSRGSRIDFPKSGRAEKMRTQKQLEFVEQNPEKRKNVHREYRATEDSLQDSTNTEEHMGVEKEQERNSKSAERKQVETYLRLKRLPHKAWDSRGIQVHRSGE